MIIKKFFVFAICFGLIGNAIAQTLSKNSASTSDVSPELKENALSLLNNLVRESEQFSLPHNRIRARMSVADLLWESNEKQARTLFQNVVTELITMLGQIPTEIPETEEENYEKYALLNDVKSLRNDFFSRLLLMNRNLRLKHCNYLAEKMLMV